MKYINDLKYIPHRYVIMIFIDIISININIKIIYVYFYQIRSIVLVIFMT